MFKGEIKNCKHFSRGQTKRNSNPPTMTSCIADVPSDVTQDKCPICLALSDADSAFFVCCGHPICWKCKPIFLASAHGKNCPVCRQLLPETYKEMFDQTLKHARKNRPWAQFFLGK